jgi:hypothetical protein
MANRRAAACAAVLCASCAAKDTAILLEVGGSVRVDRLSFAIGLREGALFIKDSASSIEASVTGRDLDQNPYRLMVHDSDPGASGISGAVLGYAANGSAPLAFAALPPVSFTSGEILLYHLELGPVQGVVVGATGCVTWPGGQIVSPTDQDCDGSPVPEDCNDHDPNVRPGIPEVCGNGIDDNCNGQIDESPDADGDGWTVCAGDCDDHDKSVHPGAVEICDGKDNNCDGRCDEGFDADGDGYTTCGTQILPDGTCKTGVAADCNDHDRTVHPGAAEICDGKDDDCDGVCDEGLDPDGDGFTSCGSLAGVCGAPVPALVDCGEGNAAVHPYAHEICDGRLDNCDGQRETAEPCYRGPGPECAVGTRSCDDTKGVLAPTCAPTSDPLLDVTVDAALCTAYSGACATSPEPWRCATEMAAAARFECTLAWRRVPGSATQPATAELCTPASTPAPNLGLLAGCQMVLVGGVDQEGYQIGFVPRGTTESPAPVLDNCSGDLVVVAATNPYLPQPDQWVVLTGGNGHQTRGAAHFAVTPMLVTSCPPSPLSCTMQSP